MPQGFTTPPDVRAQVRTMRRRGMTSREIAGIVGLHPDTVKRIAAGIEPPQVIRCRQRAERIQRMRERGMTPTEIAQRLGVTKELVYHRAPIGRVDNTPLREAFQRSGRSATDVARDLGWMVRGNTADGRRLLRALGIIAEWGRCDRRQTVALTTALRIADALGLDPVDIGA